MVQKITVPNRLASDLQEIGRHHCEGEDVQQERLAVLTYLVDVYVGVQEEDFDEKDDGQLVYVGN
jgi:hypothetical protein